MDKDSKKFASRILKKKEKAITKAFQDTPLNELSSLMRGVRLGFDLSMYIIKKTASDLDINLDEEDDKDYDVSSILEYIKNSRGGEA